jgi:hypothetical protein
MIITSEIILIFFSAIFFQAILIKKINPMPLKGNKRNPQL